LLVDYSVRMALEAGEKTGCAYLVAHVYPESIEWYKKKGFRTYVKEIAGRETIPMYFEL